MSYRTRTTPVALFILTVICFQTLSHAQLNVVTTGDASDLGNNCFEITPDQGNKAGGVWYDNPIDFANDFTIYYQNNFGTKDSNGADGMALVFKKNADAEIGGTGQGIGYAGIDNTLIVEFDTFQNGGEGDLTEDHIGIMSNGNANHSASTSLAGPIQASATNANIEDGINHEIKIVWIAGIQSLNVYFDCDLRLSATNDVKTTIFNGDDSVYFGFVGSTGGYSNLHQVCFNRISFVANLNLVDTSICSDETIQLDATIPSGVSYSWSPTSGVSDPTIANPTFSPTSTTNYTVTISDVCGDVTTEDILITLNSYITPSFPASAEFFCDGNTNPLTNTSNEGITGSWSPAFDSTTTATYTFTPDAGQCADPATLTVVVDARIIPTFSAVNDICVGETLDPLPTTSNEGISGAWSPAIDNTLTTTYTFTPDAGQCADTTDLEVRVVPLTVTDFTTIAPICIGSANPLLNTSVNGITGAWSPAFDNTTTTTYTFTPDANQCADTTDLEVTITPLIVPDFAAIAPICIGSANPLLNTSVNGITGMWDPAFDDTTTTTYTFRPGANQCADTTDLEVVITPLIVPDFAAIAPICVGSANPLLNISLDGITGGWSPAFDDTTTTSYTFTPDANQCADTASMTVVVNQKIVPTFTHLTTICEGDASTLLNTSNEGVTGDWSPAFDNTVTASYTFTPFAGQCAGSISKTITVNPLVIPIFTQVDPICIGGVLLPLPTTSTNGTDGTWSPAIDNMVTTEYTFTPTPVAGICFEDSKMTIVVLPQITPLFTQVDPICVGSVLMPLPTVSVDGITGRWSPAMSNVVTTTYMFSPDPNQCADPTTMTIVVNPINTLTVSATILSEDFDANQIISVTVTGGSGTYEYQLDGGVWQSSAVFENVLGCNEHTVAVRDALGCSTIPEEKVMIMAYPKFFTPNGDGFNDSWNIECLRKDSSAVIRIFDRFGKLLIQFKPSQSAWSGAFNGAQLTGTDYWFTADYLNSVGVKTQFKAHFSLKR